MAVLNRRTKLLFLWKRCCNWETIVLSTSGEISQRAFNSEFLSLMNYNCKNLLFFLYINDDGDTGNVRLAITINKAQGQSLD